jgi:hypothetical protein
MTMFAAQRSLTNLLYALHARHAKFIPSSVVEILQRDHALRAYRPLAPAAKASAFGRKHK